MRGLSILSKHRTEGVTCLQKTAVQDTFNFQEAWGIVNPLHGDFCLDAEEEGQVEIRINTTLLKTMVSDITTLDTEAIVNAANSSLMGGGGVDGAIHRAGGPAILEECKRIVAEIGRLPAGEAVITTAGNMPSRHVIHTVGPVWHGGKKNEPELLKNAYWNSMKIALENGIKSVAFPSISTGVYGYPVDKAAEVSVRSVVDFIHEHPGSFSEVIFCAFDQRTEKEYARALAEY
jgi:O-acetyl-ADP-ribose deacetylase (regulator of RNase III)